MDNNDAKKLALGVITQAVEDWRFLCEGGEETRFCNFDELTQFFKVDCDTYLTGTDISAEKIYSRLVHEKAVSNHEAKRQKKREQRELKKIFTLKSQTDVI